MYGLIRGISPATAYIIVGVFFVFMVLVITLHCHLKKQHAKWLDNPERFGIYRFEWENDRVEYV